MRLSVTLVTVATAALMACSADTAATPESRFDTSKGQLSVGSRSDLPTCEASKESLLAYVRDEKRVVSCSNGQWVDVELRADSAGTVTVTEPVDATPPPPPDAGAPPPPPPPSENEDAGSPDDEDVCPPFIPDCIRLPDNGPPAND